MREGAGRVVVRVKRGPMSFGPYSEPPLPDEWGEGEAPPLRLRVLRGRKVVARAFVPDADGDHILDHHGEIVARLAQLGFALAGPWQVADFRSGGEHLLPVADFSKPRTAPEFSEPRAAVDPKARRLHAAGFELPAVLPCPRWCSHPKGTRTLDAIQVPHSAFSLTPPAVPRLTVVHAEPVGEVKNRAGNTLGWVDVASVDVAAPGGLLRGRPFVHAVPDADADLWLNPYAARRFAALLSEGAKRVERARAADKSNAGRSS